MSPRLARLVPPLLVLLTAGFALYQLFLFGIALRTRNWPLAALYLGMGIAGLAIASGLRSRTKGR